MLGKAVGLSRQVANRAAATFISPGRKSPCENSKIYIAVEWQLDVSAAMRRKNAAQGARVRVATEDVREKWSGSPRISREAASE